MRLKSIKLAGFKSFVDPTTFHLSSNLIGVVGPNGCGKSNIIDAVRWVMGESSARMLRGESMSDVIFSGSNMRKPVGAAIVELIFDNSDGSVQGEYAGYNEISIKRQVEREGQSIYSLNGTRCRRRDITDIFLGTGLGPRSYSIIEQGMISQVVESRPEDLRVFLEEAAGISKYKERRRETENRIRHTRENLERLEDLRSEVDKQLQHLKRQARQAERYKKLKSEYRRREAEVLALNWRGLRSKLEQRAVKLASLETRLEEQIAGQRAIEASLEQEREQQAAATEGVNAVQADLYEVGGDIARIEQAVQHRKELHERQEEEHRAADRNWQELQEHLALDRVQIEELRSATAELEPKLEVARKLENETADAAQVSEERRATWQKRWDEFSVQSGEQNRQADIERTHIDHLDAQISEQAGRLKLLAEENQNTDTTQLETDLARLGKERGQVLEQGGELESKLLNARGKLSKQAAGNRELIETLNACRQQQQQKQGRLASLEALQQAALGEDKQDIRAWLTERGVADSGRLAQKLQVESGWEIAVETALGDFLEGFIVEQPLGRVAVIAGLEAGNLALLADGGESQNPGSEYLAAQVTGPLVLGTLLKGILIAEDLNAALALSKTLKEGESVITRAGEWLGPGWVRVARSDPGSGGVIAREQELKALRKQLAKLREQEKQVTRRLSDGEKSMAELEQSRDEVQTQVNMNLRRAAELDGQIQSKQSRIDHLDNRAEQIRKETERLNGRIADHGDSVKQARVKLQDSIEQMAGLEVNREQLDLQRGEIQSQRDQTRAAANAAREAAHTLALQLESKRAALGSTEQSVARMTAQLQQIDERRKELLRQVEKSGDPDKREAEQLKKLLEKRLLVDRRLTEARQRTDQINLKLRQLEQQRGQAGESIQKARNELDSARLDQEGIRVKTEALAEQVEHTEFELETLQKELGEDADITAWEQALEKLAGRIGRLEPVNLAAIQEFDERSERKQYLDQQNTDLTTALETLEAAIRKIDRKTRTRFKETFDRVNTGVQELFPRLFGGGHGYLELVGDDLLTAGVAIMARPPGKRISHIHLLSGGEKALTAVSLVFSIFRLNPAPFCMLDEVDAPLDDANVGRFSELVKEMSESVQFLFVTHNKITMEVAHQLTGVTMREAGASRLVSVDIAEAERMANA